MLSDYLPRSDVGSGSLNGALTVLIMLVLQNDGVFSFETTQAAIAVVLTFLGGYIPKTYKQFWTAVVAALASLLTSAVGYFLFAQPFDKALISSLLATVAVAIVTYAVPPYNASPLDPAPALDQPAVAPNAATAGR